MATNTSRSKIERQLEKIRNHWEDDWWDWGKGENGEKPAPYDASYSKLKRMVYRLVADCIKNDLIAVLKESVRTQAGNKTKIKPSAANDANPFYWALTAVCQADCELPRSTKSRFAQELQYAYMHNVPPEFLVGFIYQIGSSRGLQVKIDNGQKEPWFEKRLAKETKAARSPVL